jgi:MFS family permease
MGPKLLTPQFLLVAAANSCLFLILSTWSFLPLFIVEIGGSRTEAGLIMGSLGITSLGALPFIAPLIDRHGRKTFIVAGILVAGLSNAGFMLFDHYSHLIIIVRLIQGAAFITCFNACTTVAVDLIPPERRAQGIGIFGISHSLAAAVGPYLGEQVLLARGFHAYFLLLIAFGLLGFAAAVAVKEPRRRKITERPRGFFSTALKEGHLPMMAIAAAFGSGFGAMNTFFPLFAKTLGFKSGIFFVGYGLSLIFVRTVMGRIADRVHRDRLILACLTGYAAMLFLTSRLAMPWQPVLLGAFFGLLQGFAYPAMMAQMVDRSRQVNRAVVVGLFTGSFGVGINLSVPVWGFIADLKGLGFMYVTAGVETMVWAVIAALVLLNLKGNDTDSPETSET